MNVELFKNHTMTKTSLRHWRVNKYNMNQNTLQTLVIRIVKFIIIMRGIFHYSILKMTLVATCFVRNLLLTSYLVAEG